MDLDSFDDIFDLSLDDEEIQNKIENEIQKTLDKIKNGEIISFDDFTNFDIEYLLQKDEKGISYFEYHLRNINKHSMGMEYGWRPQVRKNKEAILLCIKYKNDDWIPNGELFKDENIFFERDKNGKTIIDIMFENNFVPYRFSKCFGKRYDLIDYYIKNNKDVLLSDEMIRLLFAGFNDNFLVDEYIKNKRFAESVIKEVPIEDLLNYCKKTNNNEVLKYIDEKKALFDYDENKTILEFMLDNNITPTFNYSNCEDEKTLDILLKYKRYDLLYNVSLEMLLLPIDDNKTAFDLMVEENRKGNDMHFEKMSYDYKKEGAESFAKYLILMAENDIINYVPVITDEMLLYKDDFNGNSILEWLLQYNKELTISKIIPICGSRGNEDFIILLRNFGIYDIDMDIKPKEVQFSDEYIKSYNESYLTGIVSPDEELLKELEQLFYQDGKSDKEAVKWLIESYRYLTSIDSPYSHIELMQLIEIKKNNMDSFVYHKTQKRSCFIASEGIFLNNYVIETIHHETTHALHFYLSDYYCPYELFEVIDRIKNNPEVIERVSEYSQSYYDIREKISSSISESAISDYYDSKYDGEKKMELLEFLSSSKEEKKKKYKDDYPKEVLDTILAKTYSVDEYIEQRKRVEITELINARFRIECGMIVLGDIIDGVFEGRFKNGILKDMDGKYIPCASGHGVSYYSQKSKIFKEMIADYGSLIKLKDGPELIEYLRYIVGDELVDLIAKVYEEKVVYSTKYIQDIGKGR